MKVLMISSDRNIFEEKSAVSARMVEYAKLVEELHIIILSGRNLKSKESKLGDNVWVYATNSFTSLLRPVDALSLGKRIVKEKKFSPGRDLITAQDPFECGWAALKIKATSKLALEIQLHTDPFSPYFSGFKNFVRKNMAKKILRCADGVRAVSEDMKEKLANSTRAEITILPIYVDKERFQTEPGFDLHKRYPWHFIILVASRLSREKNIGLALRVLAKIRKKFPGTGLVIVGSGPEEKRLKNLVRSLNLSGAVAFLGWQTDLLSFYKTANLFIQTSLFEGYGLSLVEAGLSGLPVVTTPVGIAKELVHEKEVLIFPPDKPDKFVEGIVDLIQNNSKRDYLRIHLKQALESKLLNKDEYLAKMKETWGKTANRVKQ